MEESVSSQTSSAGTRNLQNAHTIFNLDKANKIKMKKNQLKRFAMSHISSQLMKEDKLEEYSE